MPHRNAIILIVDDDVMLGTTIKRRLEAEGYRVPEVISRAQDFDAALARVNPDLVLLDIDLGDGKGTELAKRIPPQTPFVFVSGHTDDSTLDEASARRPSGFVVKPFEPPQLLAAIEVAIVSARSKAPAVAPKLMETLSAREREVLDQLLAHRRPPAIAKALFISQHTVRNHLKSIFAKLGVQSQQELLNLFTGH